MLLICHSSPPRMNRMVKIWEAMKHCYLSANVEDTDLPVVWYNLVRPTQANRFLLHVLYGMGEFDNEVNLLLGLLMKECYI